MATIIGVHFREVGKIYHFNPLDKVLEIGDYVIVETIRGIECGIVCIANCEIETLKAPLKPIIRVATAEDVEFLEVIKTKEKRALEICEQKIRYHKLSMKLINVEYTFDCSKILFYFTADSRVDFRLLVKDLAAVFKTRIELRQIGVRDEAKMLGGLGMCGREFCCASFLNEFQSVSIKMAKEQGLSLNPTKISGTCGRLMCCLKYEQDVYEELLSITPKCGAYVETAEGRGNVIDVNLLTGRLVVRLENKADAAPISVNKKDIKLIRDAHIRLNRDEIAALKGLE